MSFRKQIAYADDVCATHLKAPVMNFQCIFFLFILYYNKVGKRLTRAIHACAFKIKDI